MELRDYLKFAAAHDASDLYLTTGTSATARIEGLNQAIEATSLPLGRVKELAYQVMSEDQIKEFEEKLEMNLAISESGVGRFRVNIFLQRNEVAMVIRSIKMDIPSLENLGLPPILQNLIMEKRGLILFVGSTGSGKSTSLASLIDYRNQNDAGHIITIEDPIEFVHRHKKSIVNQREVGIDTPSYESALKNTLRQAPDVILIGEIRSHDTMEHALAFAETGHLCLSTLHANNANQAMDRIINFFPETQKNQILLDLSLNLKAIISQRLIPSTNGKRVAAVEILIGTPLISDLIRRGDISALKEIMSKSENSGMQTFDNAIFHLYDEGKISYDEAMHNADSQTNLRLRISLKTGHSSEEGNSLSLQNDD